MIHFNIVAVIYIYIYNVGDIKNFTRYKAVNTLNIFQCHKSKLTRDCTWMVVDHTYLNLKIFFFSFLPKHCIIDRSFVLLLDNLIDEKANNFSNVLIFIQFKLSVPDMVTFQVTLGLL